MSIKGVVVNVLRIQNGAAEFLYLKRSGGPFVDQWWPITGTPQADELPIETAIREMKEETGLTPISVYNLV